MAEHMPSDPGAGERLVRLDDGVMHVVEDGQPGAPAMLLIHGLAAQLRPTGPFPVLVFEGDPGNAKSTTTRVCKRLVDPTLPEHRALPKDERDLFVAAANSWVLAYDNISSLAPMA